MWIILGVVVAILLAALIYLATLDGNFQARRSLEIDAPLDSVFATIVDFKSWPEWSPWLMHEPETKITYSENYAEENGFYSWDGKIVGAGKLTHLEIKPGASIKQQIEFLRPFKSVNQVNWGFEARDGSTLVSWEMNGSMPFLFRFMAPRIAPMIERDYELGLALLSGYMNPASPHPEVEFIGREELEAFNYWSIPCNGNLRQLEKARRSSIETLQAIGVDKVGLALTLYHQFDPMASQYQAEVAVPVGNSTPLSNYKRHEFKGGVYFKMTLRGDLGFLPLGWYALHSHCRMHKIKLDNTRPALEIYLGDATRITDGNQFSTDLYIPVL